MSAPAVYIPSNGERSPEYDQALSLSLFPGLYDLAKVTAPLLAKPGARGRKSPYGPECLLLAVIVARVIGSTLGGIRLLSAEGLWERCMHNVALMTDREGLPATPPNRAQIQYFRDKIAASPEVQAEMEQVFRRGALAQAQHLGNLQAGVEPDWANPARQHVIHGDGTILSPYTDVRSVVHPRTGELIALGSRAASYATARIPKGCFDNLADGKSARGTNFVSMHTWTRAGRVVLGNATAAGSELWAALELTEAIAEQADGGVHTLVYDRAVSGWPVDFLMGKHRVQVLGKAVGRSSRTTRSAEDDWDVDNDAQAEVTWVKDRAERLAAEYDAEPTPAVVQILRQDVLATIFYDKQPQPVGTSLYKTSRGFDVVFSKHWPVPAASHNTPDGSCDHELVVDDAALFAVGNHPRDDYDVKLAHIPCASSRGSRRADGLWRRVSTYVIPCVQGDFLYTRTWEPNGTFHGPDSPKASRTPSDRAEADLRPLSRADKDRFDDVFSRRNDSESYNEWFQKTLPHHGRVGTETLPAQQLDFLSAAVLNNALTWDRR